MFVPQRSYSTAVYSDFPAQPSNGRLFPEISDFALPLFYSDAPSAGTLGDMGEVTSSINEIASGQAVVSVSGLIENDVGMTNSPNPAAAGPGFMVGGMHMSNQNYMQFMYGHAHKTPKTEDTVS